MPTVRTPEIDEAIVTGISQGKPLAVICREQGIDRSTVYLWRKDDAEFDRRIAHAREVGHDAIADDCMEIADDRTDEPSSRKVRIETRLKLLAKWDPKRYGDKPAGDAENPIHIVSTVRREVIDPNA